MNRCIKLSMDLIKEYLHYDPLTGDLYWKKNQLRPKRKGKPWGSRPKNPRGYINGSFFGVKCRGHQLVFFLHNGYLPEHCIDHINGNKQDNRIENLREASYACNRINSSDLSKNTSGVVGVIYARQHKNWKAAIKINGIRHHIGTAETFAEAACLRYAVEQCLGWRSCKKETTAEKYVKNEIQKKSRIMIPLRDEMRERGWEV